MASRGQPTKYRKEFAELAQNYALLGAVEKEIAGLLHITGRTLTNWKNAHPEFAEALQCGKDHADARMLGAAFRNGLAGNATIQIFWLKNRLGWRDRTDIVAKVGVSPLDDLLNELEGSTFQPKATT